MISTARFESHSMFTTIAEQQWDPSDPPYCMEIDIASARLIEISMVADSTMRVEFASDSSIDYSKIKVNTDMKRGSTGRVAMKPKLFGGPDLGDLCDSLDVRISIPNFFAGEVTLRGNAVAWALHGINQGKLPEQDDEHYDIDLCTLTNAVLLDECGGSVSLNCSGALSNLETPGGNPTVEVVTQGKTQNCGLPWRFEIYCDETDMKLHVDPTVRFYLAGYSKGYMESEECDVKCVGIRPLFEGEVELDYDDMPIGVANLDFTGERSNLVISA